MATISYQFLDFIKPQPVQICMLFAPSSSILLAEVEQIVDMFTFNSESSINYLSHCPLMSQHQVAAWHWWWIAMIFSVYLHAISYDSHCDIFLFATYTGLGWWWGEWPLAANEEVTTPDQQQSHAAWPHHLSLSWSLYPLQCSMYP